MSSNLETLSIAKLFGEEQYVIPIYQRNYAWREPQITQLIRDVYDYSITKSESNYYLGSLVVYERYTDDKIVYETIDGQQRLTTLNLILQGLKVLLKQYLELNLSINASLNLRFDSRKKSTETLRAIASEEGRYISTKDYNESIKQGFEDAKKELRRLLTDAETLETFTNYLLNKVHIMRVSVPEDTDLNHYFEIMNNRGEQLEKHEILKADMLEVIAFDTALSEAFSAVWEACSDMERYVQYGFSPDERKKIFGSDLNTLQVENIDSLARMLSSEPLEKDPSGANPENELSIWNLIVEDQDFTEKKEEDELTPERFTSVINFPNFLLHVLRIQTKSDISLDDKRLLESFGTYLKSENRVEFVKRFGYNLLKLKFIFDKYILKREYLKDRDQWSLKRLIIYKEGNISYVNTFGSETAYNEGINRELLMIQAMFHVSTPTLIYKHWLNAALYYLYGRGSYDGEDYLRYLKRLARSFLFDRFLAATRQDIETEYFQIIYDNDATPTNDPNGQNVNWDLLDRGTDVENFVFNYLDFILWSRKCEGYQKFEFTFKSSVEHYYPQNPIAGNTKLPEKVCNLFGNLCLLSASKNSKLSNHMPSAKKDYYVKAGIDSLKQNEMMTSGEWSESQIESHGEEMIAILKDFN